MTDKEKDNKLNLMFLDFEKILETQGFIRADTIFNIRYNPKPLYYPYYIDNFHGLKFYRLLFGYGNSCLYQITNDNFHWFKKDDNSCIKILFKNNINQSIDDKSLMFRDSSFYNGWQELFICYLDHTLDSSSIYNCISKKIEDLTKDITKNLEIRIQKEKDNYFSGLRMVYE